MLKAVLVLAIASLTLPVSAAETIIRQTRPSGSVDFSKPSWKVDDKGFITERRPNGTLDYSKPRYKITGDKIYTVRSSGTMDYSKPGLKLSK